MRFVIQRVCSADVSVEGKIIGQIGHGLLLFVGVSDNDNRQIAYKMIDETISKFHNKLRYEKCI